MKLAVWCVASALVTAMSQGGASRDQAEAFQEKLAMIMRHAEERRTEPRETHVIEREVNAYLTINAMALLPVGVTEPSIGAQSQGRLSGRAVVDLDVIRKTRNGGWLDPTSYMTGRLPLTASGVLRTQNGRGTFTLERAAVSGVPIPKAFLQEIVTYYTRTPEYPNGFNMDQPFELPAAIKSIHTEQGSATIVQ
jgi:hypothetical protein